MLDAIYYTYIYTSVYTANIYTHKYIYIFIPILSSVIKQIPVLFSPFTQNQKNVANKITSPESWYESYNQTLLLTQTL